MNANDGFCLSSICSFDPRDICLENGKKSDKGRSL